MGKPTGVLATIAVRVLAMGRFRPNNVRCEASWTTEDTGEGREVSGCLGPNRVAVMMLSCIPKIELCKYI